jgi:SCY1-like protein 1
VNEAKRPVPVSTSSAPTVQREAAKSPAIPESTSGEAFAGSWAADDGWNGNTEETWGDEDDAANAWGDMEDMDDSDMGAVPAVSTNHPASKKEPISRSIGSSGSSKPFGGDEEEPDFAGWLAAQSKAKTATKALPKGLSKPSVKSVGPNAQKKPVTKPATKPSATRKLDLKPKETEEDGWGDAW